MFADFKLNNNMQCHFEHHRNKKKNVGRFSEKYKLIPPVLYVQDKSLRFSQLNGS